MTDPMDAVRNIAIDCLSHMRTGEQFSITGYGCVLSLSSGYRVSGGQSTDVFSSAYTAYGALRMCAKATRVDLGLEFDEADEADMVRSLVLQAFANR